MRVLPLYINDIPDCVESSLKLFADDCVIFRQVNSFEDIERLQKDIDALYNWTEEWLHCKNRRVTLTQLGLSQLQLYVHIL